MQTEAEAFLHENYALLGAWSQPWVFGVHRDLDWEPWPRGGMLMTDAFWR